MPYDEFGNYIPGDDDLDRMRYELSLADTVKQMIKSPANDLSALTKPQTYKDILGGFGSAAESLVRGAGAAPFGMPGDIIQHFKDTPLIPGVTDKVSINDVFPGLNTVQEAVAPTPYALPQRVPANMSVAPERPKQELFGLPYATTGDILETASSRYTAPFGDKESNDFMESLGMFLSPQMAAGARKGIINMVETTGRVPSMTADSAQAFARDYANAMNGVYPETPTAGSMAADFARQGKKVARKTGEVVGETIEDLAQRRAAGEGAYASPFSPQSMMADIVVGPRSYAVRPVNAGQLLKETDLPTIKYAEANPKIHTVGYRLEDVLPYTDPEFPHNTRAEYWRNIIDSNRELNTEYQKWADQQYMKMFPDAPDIESARRAYSNMGGTKDRAEDQMRMFTEFANSPEANMVLDQQTTARDLAVKEYNELKNTPKSELKTDEAKEIHRAKVDELELELLKKNYAPELSSEEYRKRISVPSADEYLRRANAARKYMLGEFRNDIAKYIGTSQGPQMELAKRGVTIPPREELVQRAKQVSQGGKDYRELQEKRTKAGFEAEGEMKPLIVQKEAELAEQQKQLDELNAKQNTLREQHRLTMPEEPDPARNPTELGAQYRALRNPMTALIEKMQKNKKQLENFRLANAYELVSDMGFIQYPASHWRQTIPYEQRQFFPDLFAKRENGEYKIPDDAPINQVAGNTTKNLGIDFLAEQYTKAILDGRVPLIEDKPEALPKSKYKEDLSTFPEEDIYDYAKAVRDSKASPKAKEEAEAAVMSGASNKFIVYEGKRVAGAAAYDVDDSAKTIFIDHIGSLVKGTGKQMVQEIENAVPSGYRVVLTPSDKSKGFWNKLGYKPTGEGALLEKRDFTSTKEPKPAVSLEKFIEQMTKPRIKEEELKEIENSKSQVRLNDYVQRSLASTDPSLRFQNASVVELTKDNPMDVIRRQISLDGMVLDNCVAATDAPHPGINPFTNQRYDYSYPVDPATGANRGDRARNSSFMEAIHEGRQRYASLRDNVSGLPVVNINMNRTADSGSANPKFNVQYVSGYKNDQINKKYADDVRDYLNARADIIQGSGTGLNKWSIYDLTTDGGRSAAASALRVPQTALSSFDLPRFVTSKDLESLVKQPVQNTHADLVARRNDLIRDRNELLRRGEDDEDLVNEIGHLTQEIERISTQVRNAPNDLNRPSLFRRMTTEALTNAARDEGNIGNVRAVIDNLLDADSYGLRELWSDDYDFYPIALRNFTNAVRDNADLPMTLTNRTDMSAFSTQMRDRLARFAINIRDFNHMERELFARELDNYAESNINQLAENLDPENNLAGLEQIEDTHPGTIQYLRDIETRRRGNDVPQTAPALQAPTSVPRDIAEQVVPRNLANRDELVQQLTERLNNSVRSLPEDRETLIEALQQYQRDPNDIPGGILMVLPVEGRNESVRTISNYLMQQIQSRLGNEALPAVQNRSPETMNAVVEMTRELFDYAVAENFDRADLTSTLHALDARNFDHRLLRNLPEAQREAAQEDVAASLRLMLQGRNIDIPPDIFAGGVEAAPQLPAPAGNGPEAYRDRFTNELTGSREAFDNIMEAERLTPGAINEAISRTDGNARYDPDIMRAYHIESPAGVQQLNNALRQYMEGNGFDHPPRPVENAIAELERRYPNEREFVYDPEDMSSEIDYEMEGQERRLTRNQYGQLEDLVEEIQRESGEDFEDLIDAIDRMRMRQGIDGDVDAALGDIRARLIRSEEQSRLEFDRLQRNADERNRPAVVEPEHALQGALDAAEHNYHDDLVQEMRDLVDNIQNDDIRFDREPTQFIARLRDEANEYAGHNEAYSNAIDEMASFLEQYMFERAQRPRGHKRGGIIRKETGGRVEPSAPSPSVNDQSKPVTPPKRINNPDAPEFKDLFIRERAIRGGAAPSGGPSADIKQIMNPRNINYNAGGKVSVDQMRYELLRKQ